MGRTADARKAINRLLAIWDIALVRRATFEMIDRAVKPSHQDGAVLPPDAVAYLRPDHPRLLELRERYQGHPATSSSAWSEDRVRQTVDIKYFRGDTEFVYQQRGLTHPAQYAWAAEYAAQHDRLGLLHKLVEDGAFGAYVYEVTGRDVSRDLLDSVLEINALPEHFFLADIPAPTVLDIGAGYGRLAHRLCTAFPAATYYCTDAVAVSTFISEYYLKSRRLERAHVVPLDEVRALATSRHLDIAVSVHSFPECPLASVKWWIDLLEDTDVSYLFIAADEPELLSSERNGSRIPFQSLIVDAGFRPVSRTEKYVHSAAAQRFGLYPDYHFLFERS